MAASDIKLYRRRIIPDECICLDKDQILYQDSHMIVTCWEVLHPRADMSGGYSCYYLDRGYKVSRMHTSQHRLLYWYCDIIKTSPAQDARGYVFTDLLADVIVYPDHSIRIADLDETALALEKGLITVQEAAMCLNQLHSLLQSIYQGQWEELCRPILERLPSYEN